MVLGFDSLGPCYLDSLGSDCGLDVTKDPPTQQAKLNSNIGLADLARMPRQERPSKRHWLGGGTVSSTIPPVTLAYRCGQEP